MKLVAFLHSILVKFILRAVPDEVDICDPMVRRFRAPEEVGEVVVLHRHVGFELVAEELLAQMDSIN